MDLRRAARVLVSRWWVILFVGLLGLVTAVGAARWSNANIEPSYRATAPVSFLPLSEESDAAFEARLGAARTRAQGIVAPVLLDDPRLVIETNIDQGRLDFIAEAEDPESAERLAGDLRAAYLTAEPSSGVVQQYQAVLTDLESRILELRGQLADLAPEQPPAPNPDVEVQASLLSSQLSTLRQRAASISLQLAYPELAEPGSDPEALSSELETIQRLVARISADLARIQSPTAGSATTEPSVDLEALVIEQRLRNFESQYVDTSLRLLELTDTEGVDEDVLVADVTRGERSEYQAGALGFLVGILMAAGIAFASDRIRRPVLGVDEPLPATVLGSVNRARPGSRAGDPWYPRAGGTPRRRDIQALRAALDHSTADAPVTVGLAALGAPEADAQAVAADLAVSIAASGRTVLLIDANLNAPSRLPEFGSESPDLVDLLTSRNGTEDLRSHIKQALGERTEVVPDLIALRAGVGVADPVDALAGRQFREVLAAAGGVAEVTILAAPQWTDPATDAMAQRLDTVVLVSRLRTLTAPLLETTLNELRDRGTVLAGIVFLVGRTGRQSASKTKQHQAPSGTGNHRRKNGRRRAGEPAITSPEPVSAAPPRPEPAEDTASPSRDTPPRLRRRRGSRRRVEHPIRQTTEPAVSAEDHLQALVMRLLTSSPGDPMLVVAGPGRTSAAHDLLELMTDEADQRTADLDEALSNLLGCVPGRDGRMASRAALDLWLRRSFRNRGPDSSSEVAHLASPHGVLRALVHLPSFDEAFLANLRYNLGEWLRILRTELSDEIRSGDDRRVAEADRRLADIEESDRRLDALESIVGVSGVTADQLQRAGLLAEWDVAP